MGPAKGRERKEKGKEKGKEEEKGEERKGREKKGKEGKGGLLKIVTPLDDSGAPNFFGPLFKGFEPIQSTKIC